jgi:hypothetical protein
MQRDTQCSQPVYFSLAYPLLFSFLIRLFLLVRAHSTPRRATNLAYVRI